MKIKLLIFSILLIAGIQKSQSQCTWWAQSFGGSADDYIRELAKDGSGNIYATGNFSGSMTMGSFTLTSSGDNDIFLAKISESGTVVWAKSAGGLYDDKGTALSLDGSGNIYLGGSFFTSADFESTTINSASGAMAFLAKYDNNGNLTWVHETEGSYVNSVANYGTKVYYLSYEGLIEYTTAGVYSNSTLLSPSNEAIGYKVRVDASGNIIIGGTFGYPADFGNGYKTTVGSDDIFIAKYTPSKVLSWVQTGGGSNYDYFNDFGIDNLGNIVLAGSFNGSINFNGSIITPSTGEGVVLVKYSSAGSQSWVKQSGDMSDYGMSITAVAFDASNNVFHYTIRGYNTKIFNGITLTGSGAAVLAKYNGSGSILDAVQTGGYAYGSNRTMVVNSNGKIIVGESFSYNINYGSKKLMSNDNSYDFAIAKIDQFSDLKFKEPSICVIEIDAATKKNKVVWNTSGMANVNFFTIYRENKVGDMESIGTVNFGTASSFVDVNSDPVEREYTYRLSLTDVCGSEYEAEHEHKTIHLQMYAGPANRWSLIWTEYWGLDVKYFRIYRGITETNLVKYDSISSTSYTYTDMNAPSGDVFYKVEAVVENQTCGNYPSSNRISNVDGVSGIHKSADVSFFSLYPNPSKDVINIELTQGNATFIIVDPLGRILQQGEIAYLRSIDVTNLSKGIYKILVESESGAKGSKNFVVN